MLENKGAFPNTFERAIQASIASIFLFLFFFYIANLPHNCKQESMSDGNSQVWYISSLEGKVFKNIDGLHYAL